MFQTTKTTGRAAAAHPFALDERGSIAMIFAVTMTALVILLGASIDLGRAFYASTKLATALDSASLAAAKLLKDPTKTDADLTLTAQNFFQANMQGGGAGFTVIDSFSLNIDRKNTTVTASVKAWVPTTFSRIGGIERVNLPKASTVSYDLRDIEVGLQLDVTGSMGQADDAGQAKIIGLKAAVNELLDTLLPDAGQPNKVRIGLAPFASGVNAGPYAAAVTGGKSTNDCAYDRLRAADVATDTAPTAISRFKARPELITLPASSGILDCPSNAKVVALTDDKAALKASVAVYTPSTSTAGQLGTSWAWGLVSPNWSSIWPGASQPAAYTDKKTLKYVVLMTDGIYNTTEGQCGTFCGDDTPMALQSRQQARDTCDAIRAQNITIYSVGFIKKGDDPRAADTLKYCAGTTSHFYQATDADQLKYAFKSIATDISKLHLTQ